MLECLRTATTTKKRPAAAAAAAKASSNNSTKDAKDNESEVGENGETEACTQEDENGESESGESGTQGSETKNDAAENDTDSDMPVSQPVPPQRTSNSQLQDSVATCFLRCVRTC